MEYGTNIKLSLGEMKWLIDTLEIARDAITKTASLDEDEKSKYISAVLGVLGQPGEIVEIRDGADLMDEAAKLYRQINIVLDKLKAVFDGNTEWFMTVLFPYCNTSSDQQPKADESDVNEKRKFIIDILTSEKDKRTASRFVGDRFLFGIRYENEIDVIETDKYTIHLFPFEMPEEWKTL